MAKVKANDQRGLWECIGTLLAKKTDVENAIGPFELGSDAESIPRHMDCSNYDFCLSFAAHRNWASFSCQRCRKTIHGRFEDKK